MQNRLGSVSVTMGIMLLGFVTTSQASKCQYPFAQEIVSSTYAVDDLADNILGAPDGVVANFDNIGSTPSTVVVAFASHIIDRDGNDFSITYGDLLESQKQETSEVLVKGPGYEFTKIGIIEPTPGLRVRHVSQVAYFDLATLGFAEADQVMVRNIKARTDTTFEGLDIDGFTAIHCADGAALPDDSIALHVSGLHETQATCWNTTTHEVFPASKDDEGKHSCAHLPTDRNDAVTLTVVGSSAVRQ